MEEVGKWRVTYSKHMTQKRKVYHDGFLHLLSNNKVLLFDESHNLLDSKFLNNNVALALKPGFSMPFPSFLVHIADYIINPNQTSATTFCLSPTPSLRIIREFKKYQAIKYTTSTHPSLPILTPSSPPPQEWEALYTTHITQKAKKYHDGFLHLILCGSHARQAVLYDSSKTQIDKRFLNKDEIICSGQTLKFDAHLVDIGDALANTTTNDAALNTHPTNYNNDQVKSENVVYNPQRCKQPTKQNLLRTENAIKIGESRNLAGSNMCRGSSFGGSRTNKMNPTKTPHTLMPPRGVHHILSVLKKPAGQDDVPIPEKAAVEQCLSRSSAVQFVIDGKPNEGIIQLNKVTNEYDCDKATNRVSAQTWSTDDHSQPQTFYNMEAAQPSTDCNSNYVERPVFNQGSVFEPPKKIEPSIGITLINKLQANDIPRQSVIDHPVQLAGFMGSISSGSQETRSTHQKPCDKLLETDASSVERTSSTSIKPKAKRPFNELNGMKIKRNNVNSEILLGNLDCPSFDLGI